jgi:hypothetical protein
MLSAVGKFFAALIIVFTIAKLAPMCARLPADLSTVAAPLAPAAPEAPPVPTVSTATAAVPAPVVAPAPVVVEAPKPAAKAGEVSVATYRSRKMFPVENEKYIVSVLRANKSDKPAVGFTMTLSTRLKGEVVERAESGPGQTLAAGTTSYFGLNVSTPVFDELLGAAEEPGNELEWAVSYRFEGEDAAKRRCYRLRALPRRREPEGIEWRKLGESRDCK